MYYRREVGEIGRICEVDTLDFREVDTNLSNMNKCLYWHVLWVYISYIMLNRYFHVPACPSLDHRLIAYAWTLVSDLSSSHQEQASFFFAPALVSHFF